MAAQCRAHAREGEPAARCGPIDATDQARFDWHSAASTALRGVAGRGEREGLGVLPDAEGLPAAGDDGADQLLQMKRVAVGVIDDAIDQRGVGAVAERIAHQPLAGLARRRAEPERQRVGDRIESSRVASRRVSVSPSIHSIAR